MNALGIGIYCMIALACMAAFAMAMQGRRPARERMHWLGVGAFFLLLAAIRLADAEEAARSALRSVVQSRDLYALRGEYQLALVLMLTFVVIAAILIGLRKWSGRKPAAHHWIIIASRLAVLGYFPLYAVRIISFHATDTLLYSTPIHLNWLIDGALAGTAGFCALIYILIRGRATFDGKPRTRPASRDDDKGRH